MRNLDIADTREKLEIFAKVGLLSRARAPCAPPGGEKRPAGERSLTSPLRRPTTMLIIAVFAGKPACRFVQALRLDSGTSTSRNRANTERTNIWIYDFDSR